MRGQETRTAGLGWHLAAFIALFLIFYQKIGALSFYTVAAGLDPSWSAALVHGLERGLLFGTDVVFTGGPLSSLYTRHFSVVTAYPLAVLSLLITVFLARVWSILLVERGSLAIIAMVCLVSWLTVFNSSDSILLFVPLLAGLYGLSGGRSRILLSGAGAFLCGLIILAKFSVFPIALLAMLVLDVKAAVERRLPMHLLLLAAGTASGFVVCGQPLGQLPAFMAASLDVSSGYSSAMSVVTGLSVIDLATWLSITTVFLGAWARALWKGRREHGFWLPFARFIVMAGFLFVSFKAGMVRHDLHALTAWASLSLAVLLSILVIPGLSGAAVRRRMVLAAILVLPGHAMLYYAYRIVPFSGILNMPSAIVSEVKTAAELIMRPSVWLANLEARNKAALAAIKAQTPLPPLDGTVDIIPSAQSAVIANGLAYRPRPTIQEYSTYSPRLIARNRAFFAGESAPDYLIMQPGSIDGRHPASAEGALWPLFFSRYEAVQSSPLGLILKRRATPIADVLAPAIEKTASFGDEVAFPAPDGAWMVSIDIRPTLLGRLVDLVYRPPMTEIAVRYSDGSSGTYRLIPGMAADGMLLSPHVASASDYLIVSTGNADAANLKHATSFTVRTGIKAGLFYDRALAIRFTALNAAPLRAANQNQFVRDMQAKAGRVIPLLRNNDMRPPTLEPAAEGVFAHAPASLRLPVQPGSTLRLFFGLRDGSWSGGGNTDGVCFIVRSPSAGLAERCLDPVRNQGDRGEQTMDVDVPADVTELRLDTACRAACTWDWSYWGGVEGIAGK
ncbi:hypothetical protein SAMN05880590_10220 [Rhizobium sp. RU35A]|uniref:hypothetical protein n=1 Tax=Rhizobium sp. RU35A TaxID=1907414 RepID=UPI0009574F99|nr:hypothetical protein [Rhizobium sp. RU35A]SIQ10372.1 hypothetical protein SAMN05880590_10220 [Rhizobium sp. RU35A]